MDFNIAFGCGIFAYTGKFNMFGGNELDQKKWKNWRSFFFQGSGSLKMEFYEH